ncbi:tetratricopeptide repeat protein [bacterium]|nr:tetratricopeptide repeat protein [bacterium]
MARVGSAAGRRLGRSGRAVVAGLAAGALLAGTGCSGGEIRSHLRDGREHYTAGRYEEAQLEGLYVLLRAPEHPEALELVASSLLALDRDSEAEGYFRTLIGLEPARATTATALFDQRARVDFAAGQKSRAARRWAAALAFSPRLDLGPYAFFMAEHAYARRDWPVAMTLYGQAIAAYPDSSAAQDAVHPYAVSLHQLAHDLQALDVLEPFLRREPRHRLRHEAVWLYQELLIEQARAANGRMDYERAVAYLRRALGFGENPPLRAEALLELGASYESLREYQEAVACYRKVIDESNTQTGRVYDRAIERLATLEKARLR